MRQELARRTVLEAQKAQRLRKLQRTQAERRERSAQLNRNQLVAAYCTLKCEVGQAVQAGDRQGLLEKEALSGGSVFPDDDAPEIVPPLIQGVGEQASEAVEALLTPADHALEGVCDLRDPARMKDQLDLPVLLESRARIGQVADELV